MVPTRGFAGRGEEGKNEQIISEKFFANKSLKLRTPPVHIDNRYDSLLTESNHINVW